MNAFAGFAREPEVTQRLPVDLRDLFGVEWSEWSLSFGSEIEPEHFGRIDRAFPACDQDRRRRFGRDAQVCVDTLGHVHRERDLAAVGRHGEELFVSCFFGGQVDRTAVGRKGEAADWAIELCG